MKRIVFTLCFFIAVLSSAHAGVMYNCIDRDGKSIFTDTPQDGMKCKLQSDSSIDTPQKEQTQRENKESKLIQTTKNTKSKLPSLNPYSDCLKEFENNLDSKCLEDIARNSMKFRSGHCIELIKSDQWEKYFKDCQQEADRIQKQMRLAIKKCYKRPISTECENKMEVAGRRIQEENKKCSDAMKRLYSICGDILKSEANAECYDKHRTELEAACGRRLDSQPAVPPDREMP